MTLQFALNITLSLGLVLSAVSHIIMDKRVTSLEKRIGQVSGA